MEWGGAPEESECGDESCEPETVVAVKMGDEDVVDEREMYVSSAQLQLCAFATIYHEEFVANSDNL